MLNINELETKWRRYKIKSLIPYLVIGISTIIIVVILYLVLNTKDDDVIEHSTSKTQEPRKTNNLAKKNHTKEIVQSSADYTSNQTMPEHNYKQDTNKIILSPSLGFMSNIKHGNIYNNNDNDMNIEVVDSAKENILKAATQAPQEEIYEEEIDIPKSSILIKRNDSKDDIEYIIKRFKKNNNPALSLFIAKKYYSLGEYHKSYNYALITNKINDKMENSWFIFVKSLVKLKQKDEAIKTLERYISHSHSNQAQILLNEIKTGKFQ